MTLGWAKTPEPRDIMVLFQRG